MGEARPDLLTLYTPEVSISLCPSREAGQVRTCSRLGEELAPDFIVAGYWPEEPVLLIGSAPFEEHGSDLPDSDWIGEPWNLVAA
jgi:hypothetical protein